jgi:hypothetical protein
MRGVSADPNAGPDELGRLLRRLFLPEPQRMHLPELENVADPNGRLDTQRTLLLGDSDDVAGGW